ncbi:GMC oxidoreductase [Melittangium boletus]|uniref:Cholesterol oxidase n=1 Tax=Melittangium boletus DSM 14713 TaxID=1294270 RepID=A0A250ISB7_9BACT|nr:GMC family oxidoreductase [Melittangium boletus]ATB34140.1 cholesterol oxidase [Melittangium boletus DSM 14713]
MSPRREHFDVIIVGSGFGGSVMAWRLAEAGLRVCLLERGKAYPPGSFPRSPYDMRRNFWDPSEGLHGLFNIWSFSGLAGVVSSGLGGGSLIYANVLLRKDEKTFIREDPHDGGYEYWPVTREDLESHYDAVEKMLGAQRYPFDQEPYRHTAKTIAMKLAAERLGRQDDWELPPLAVTFGNPGEPPVPGEPIRERHPNLHGRTRLTCRLCGECDIGCNYGSKNTLDYTYLSAAKRAGAEIRVRSDVRSFRHEGEGYVVEYVDHSRAQEGERPSLTRSRQPCEVISADKLVLSAGTFGTTFLMFKNQGALPGLSTRLGAQFNGNGDMLAFLSKCVQKGKRGREPRLLDGGHGPVITSTIHVRDALAGGEDREFNLQDAGHPEFVNWLHEGLNQFAILRRFARLGIRLAQGWLGWSKDTDVSAEIANALGDCVGSSSSMPLLAMGRDLPNGHMSLNEDGLLAIDWKMRGDESYFRRVQGEMARVAEVLEGKFIQYPLGVLNRIITVHPLGGCPMGRSVAEGVVDSHGEVFNHPGLYVADGSVLPGPTGVNPSLTIAALADRFADHLIEHSRRPPRSRAPVPEESMALH